MTKMNGNTHTTINIPPCVCSVAEQKWGKTTVLDGRRQRQTEQVELLPRPCCPPVVALLLPVVVTVRGGGTAQRPRGEMAENWWCWQWWQQQLQHRCHCWGLASLAFVIVGSKSHRGGNTIRLGIHRCGWHVAFIKPLSPSRRQQSTYQNNCRGYLCGVLCCLWGAGGGGREGEESRVPSKNFPRFIKLDSNSWRKKKKKAIQEIKFGFFEKMG